MEMEMGSVRDVDDDSSMQRLVHSSIPHCGCDDL